MASLQRANRQAALRVNGEQLGALKKQLEAIGKALKPHLLDFSTAAELGDQVKAGRVDDVTKRLAELRTS